MLSIIIPAFNEELELPRTLCAIRTAIENTGHAFEIIVVDDSSIDATAAIARNFGARVVSVCRRHIAAARNAGASAAGGDILFFVDADTLIDSEHINGALRSLEEGYSGGSAWLRMDGDVPFWARIFLGVFCAVYFAANLGAGAFLFTRRETYEAVGGFDEQYFAGEETYFSIALKKFGPFKVLRHPIITSGRKVRMHSARSVLTQSAAIMFGGKRALRARADLNLWYDGKREKRIA